MKKTITISSEVWADLLRIKADLKARSFDEVIKKLILTWRGENR